LVGRFMRLRAAGGGRPHLLAVVCPRPDYHVSAAGAAGEFAPARRFRRRIVQFLPEKYCAIRKELTQATTISYLPHLAGSGGIRRDQAACARIRMDRPAGRAPK
jgi:hypothetical protein